MVELRTKFHFELGIRAAGPTGMIFHAQPMTEPKFLPDYMIISLQDKKIIFSIELGSGVAVITSPPIELNKWVNLKIKKDAQNFEMLLNGKSVGKGKTPGKSQTLNIDPHTFVGKDVEHKGVFKKTASHGDTEVAFKGCLRAMKVDGKGFTAMEEKNIKPCPH